MSLTCLSTSHSGAYMRKPILNAWKMLNIKKGTPLFVKGDEKSKVKTVSEETMELELQEGKTKKRFAGLVKTEQYLRGVAGTQKKRCDGWDYFGVMQDDKFVSIQKLYNDTERDTLLERQ